MKATVNKTKAFAKPKKYFGISVMYLDKKYKHS